MASKRYFIVLIAFLLFFQVSQSQTVTNSGPLAHVPLKSEKIKKRSDFKKKKEAVPYFYRHHRKLAGSYDGYAIELARSDVPLKRNDPLFRQFGNVYYDRTEGAGYVYLIKVDFTTKKAMKKFLKNIVRHRAPDARIVSYRMGVRKG